MLTLYMENKTMECNWKEISLTLSYSVHIKLSEICSPVRKYNHMVSWKKMQEKGKHLGILKWL